MKYRIYTDGSALGQNKKSIWDHTPTRGGWAFVVVDEKGNVMAGASGDGSDDAQETTNNRMELMAILKGVRAAYKIDDEAEYTVYSDSKYSVDCIEEYGPVWKTKGWKKTGGGKPSNLDLIKPLMEAKKYINYKALWIKGHNGDEFNEMVDEMANTAATKQEVK